VLGLKRKASPKEIADLLLQFTVLEPPHRQLVMSSVSHFDEYQKGKIRDEIMFLDLAVIGSLMQTNRVKQCWPKSENIVFEYIEGLKNITELGGLGFDSLLGSVEVRERAYQGVFEKPLNVARFGVGQKFAALCGLENDSSVEIAGSGEFVSVVNYIGDLLGRYRMV